MDRIRDNDIRSHILENEIKKICEEDPSSAVCEELGILWGASRIDIAVINGELHGFEIKSEADKLSRLPQQADLYNQIFDKVTLYVYETHMAGLDFLKDTIKDWEINMVSKASSREQIITSVEQHGKYNNETKPFAICHLLWHAEVSDILNKHNLLERNKNKPKKVLYQILCDRLEENKIKEEVRKALKARQCPGTIPSTDEAPNRCDEKSRL